MFGFLAFLVKQWFSGIPCQTMVFWHSLSNNGFLAFLVKQWFSGIPCQTMDFWHSLASNGFLIKLFLGLYIAGFYCVYSCRNYSSQKFRVCVCVCEYNVHLSGNVHELACCSEALCITGSERKDFCALFPFFVLPLLKGRIIFLIINRINRQVILHTIIRITNVIYHSPLNFRCTLSRVYIFFK